MKNEDRDILYENAFKAVEMEKLKDYPEPLFAVAVKSVLDTIFYLGYRIKK